MTVLVTGTAGFIVFNLVLKLLESKEPHNTPCEEGQYGAPTSVYGLTKLNGKQVI